MVDYQEILSQVIEKVSELSGRPVSEKTDLVEELALDSMKAMRLIQEIEDHFDISIPINLLPEIRTVEDLARKIEKLLDGSAR